MTLWKGNLKIVLLNPLLAIIRLNRNKLKASFYLCSDPSSDHNLADRFVLAAIVLEFLPPGFIYAHSSRLTIVPIICCANKITTTANSPHDDYILQSNCMLSHVISEPKTALHLKDTQIFLRQLPLLVLFFMVCHRLIWHWLLCFEKKKWKQHLILPFANPKGILLFDLRISHVCSVSGSIKESQLEHWPWHWRGTWQ